MSLYVCFTDSILDINDIMRACGFSSVSYDASATASASSITVSASRVTDTAQLTTTVNPSETGVLGAGSGSGNNDGNNDSNNDDDDNGAAQAVPGMLLYAAGAAVAGALMLQ